MTTLLPEWLSFAWPWLALAAPLPWLLALVVRPSRPQQAALRLPGGLGVSALASEGSSGISGHWLQIALALLAWLALVAAAMRPQALSAAQSAPVTGRNLMLAVDLSGSMQEKDFLLAGRSVDRLTATKAVAADFIGRRAGDRLGLILFGERAYLQAPLTFDRTTLRTLLLEAVIGLAGEKTAIGDAVGLAVKRVREAERPDEQHVLVLLTDGANTAGEIEPLKAAELAASVGLRIYTIGIGAERSALSGGVPRMIAPSRDLDERTLKQIAASTGGRYFRALDTGTLTDIYGELDQLEPAADEADGLRAYDDLFYWPGAVSAALFAACVLVGWLPGGVRRD